MPTKGSTLKPIRFDDAVLAAISAELERINARNKAAGKSDLPFGEWVRQACIEKLKHSARSRGVKAPQLAGLKSTPEAGIKSRV